MHGIIGDTANGGAHPTFIAAIHLCGTLSLRAVQLYNECAALGACGFALAPCCLPPAAKVKRPVRTDNGGIRRWRRLYTVSGSSFDAAEIDPRPPATSIGADEPLNRYTPKGAAPAAAAAETLSTRPDARSASAKAVDAASCSAVDHALAIHWDALRKVGAYDEADAIRRTMRERGIEPSVLLKTAAAGVPSAATANGGGAKEPAKKARKAIGKGGNGGSGSGSFAAERCGVCEEEEEEATAVSHDRGEGGGGKARFARYTRRLFDCIACSEKSRREIALHKTRGLNYEQEVYLFGHRPFCAPPETASEYEALIEGVGCPVVSEGWGEEEQTRR